MLTPTVVAIVTFLAVTGLVGVLAFVFRDTNPKTATRLELLVGKRRREDDDKADILRKAAFDGDKKTFFEAFMPRFISLKKLFEQADCHINPATLGGIGLLLGCAAASFSMLLGLPFWLAPVNALILLDRKSVV